MEGLNETTYIEGRIADASSCTRTLYLLNKMIVLPFELAVS
jgi:hypothetical protein